MNKDYEDIDKLLADVKQDILLSVSGGEVDKSVKKLYGEKTIDVYDKYTPRTNRSRYRHGISGSFADEVNFKSSVSEKRNIIEYELHNERVSDCNCSYCRSKSQYLDHFIEEGIAGRSRIPKRPAYEWTEQELDSSDIVEKALEESLKSKGWELD